MGSADGKRRGGGLRTLASVLPRAAKAALKRRGFAEASVVTDWPEIVGPQIAARSAPRKLTLRESGRGGGTLEVIVSGALATELQHLEPQVLERINGYFGYRAVARLKLVHGPLAAPEVEPPPAAPPASGDATTRIERDLESVREPELREALARLGRSIASRRPGSAAR